MAEKFTTKIEIINGNPFIFVPAEILTEIFIQARKDKGPIPVKGKLNNTDFKQTLVKYGGDWRLYLNGLMLKNAGFKFKTGEINIVVGSAVSIEVSYDEISRKIQMHPKLSVALAKDKKATTTFEALPPYKKQEILRYLGFLKSEETMNKNIGRILKHLRGEETDALYPLMFGKKKDKKLVK